ncbi:MAG: dihydroorotate dehydrogenase [Actinomycetota bacterium]|nr:dihydroorotate dehydrogenase [Actinomycetota bacterium]
MGADVRRRRGRGGARVGSVDMATRVGSVELGTPVMTASGTAGRGAELGAYGPLERLGAVVVKSLSADPWPGNPAPRVWGVAAGLLNSVGLQGPGVAAWVEEDLPALVASGALVVASIWGRSAEEFERAGALLSGVPGIAAVEVNVSCPNVEDRSRMFAHSPAATAEAVAAAGASGLPRWAKLSPNVADVCEIAAAALGAGAEALTLVNTLLGMAIDVERRCPVLGAGGGGLSGPALHPVAVRAVWECRAAFPAVGIVGAGGVTCGRDAVELLMAGADAVQVGTATFGDPRSVWKVSAEIERWCRRHGVGRVAELVGAARTVLGTAGAHPGTDPGTDPGTVPGARTGAGA